MPTYTIEITTFDPEADVRDDRTASRTIEYDEAGCAEDIAQHLGANMGVDYGSNLGEPLWRIRVSDSAGSVEYTEDDEASRRDARNRIVNEWIEQAAPLRQKVNFEKLLDDPDPENLTAAATLYGLRDIAMMRLELLGFRVVLESPESTEGPVYDRRSTDGLLRSILAARRTDEEADEERDALIRWAAIVKVPVAHIAEAGGVSSSRVYQIRDGRR